MTKTLLLALLLSLPLSSRAAEPSKWTLERSRLTYKISHTLHGAEGASVQARGKGVCDASGCRFLVAAPVNTFESGDSNRDLHMIETTRGAQFPMVTVNVTLPGLPPESEFTADLDIQFAGERAAYKGVKFQVAERSGAGLRFTGIIPLKISDFKIPAPSLLGISIKDEVPVSVDMSWTKN